MSNGWPSLGGTLDTVRYACSVMDLNANGITGIATTRFRGRRGGLPP